MHLIHKFIKSKVLKQKNNCIRDILCYPYPSCLILGYNINNKILHIVCGISEDTVHMITAYYPNTDKWEEDMKTRREK